jgi:hypothetical protein
MAARARKSVNQGVRSQLGRHEGFLRHKGYRWLVVAVILCVGAGAVYALVPVQPRPGGGTWYGYTLGTISALLIVWLTLIGIRKRAITSGVWSLKAWLSAHVYLGLSLLVLATLHTGFKLGWNVHTLAYALMILVIASGAFGAVVYAILPERLSENRRETTQRQMLETLRSLDRQLNDAAQPLSREAAGAVRLSLEKTEVAGGFFARLSGRYPNDGNFRALLQLSALPYPSAGTPAAAATEQVVNLLVRKAEVLARIRRHVRLRAVLEVWLKVHVPATLALLAALSAHIISVFFYW